MNIGGIPELCEKLHIGDTFASALKKAAGITARKFDINIVEKWWQDHPEFRIEDAFPRKKKDRQRAVQIGAPVIMSIGTDRIRGIIKACGNGEVRILINQ